MSRCWKFLRQHQLENCIDDFKRVHVNLSDLINAAKDEDYFWDSIRQIEAPLIQKLRLFLYIRKSLL